ncbi:hypothetical protein [Ruegeria jejuensis]|uniref:hypothetical protein n=1 Tax=Ruegeria jejuensis TaxID=3233338 RepID=UPI00355BCF9F
MPIWIWIVVIVEIITPILFGVMAYLDITIMFPDQTGLSYLATLYISRNILIGLGLAAMAFIFRSYIGVFVFVLVRMGMETSDFTYSVIFARDIPLQVIIPGGILIYLVIPAIALRAIWPQVRAELALLR